MSRRPSASNQAALAQLVAVVPDAAGVPLLSRRCPVPGCVQRRRDGGQGGVLPGHADDELVGLIADGLEARIGSPGDYLSYGLLCALLCCLLCGLSCRFAADGQRPDFSPQRLDGGQKFGVHPFRLRAESGVQRLYDSIRAGCPCSRCVLLDALYQADGQSNGQGFGFLSHGGGSPCRAGCRAVRLTECIAVRRARRFGRRAFVVR
ncbi:hypothetical protein RZR38_24730 [Citrobacter freundii]|uniref:hypothetical protein n=1 Tax=Citrobacter freundii TaxID=546 RepID=UPI00292B332B|nr:hypothetical protein [Citrobacter freundii]MDV1858938.1 hypothetical protein [Citrobacter freundii]MEB0420132.1 hypothetical protein [Citrobacter freundii]